ncbi:PP0621 family protein [Leucothrix arctica]|uniref:PP0621 family protein n=1 Tax=Leucothrix arctica TaxID=1481894 RepID=UPI0014784916
MFRLILLFVLLAVSLYAVKLWQRGRLEKTKKPLTKSTQSQKMVPCDECGLHVPEQEAIKIGDNNFCSLEHAKPPK